MFLNYFWSRKTGPRLPPLPSPATFPPRLPFNAGGVGGVGLVPRDPLLSGGGVVPPSAWVGIGQTPPRICKKACSRPSDASAALLPARLHRRNRSEFVIGYDQLFRLQVSNEHLIRV